MHPFEQALSVYDINTDLISALQSDIEWSEFWLNPRRLRGSDFLMRWSQGMWSEERIIQALNVSQQFWAIPYGPSGVAPTDDVRAYELYFERLERAGLGKVKRPDVLIFRRADVPNVIQFLDQVGGTAELPFIPEEELGTLLEKAVVAIECENSLWKAKMMPNYGTPLTPQKRLGGLLGLKKSAVLPTVIIKQEDRQLLSHWQTQHQIPIHVWHSFYDLAFGLSLDKAEQLIADGLVLPREQIFQAPGGATTTKLLYNFYYHYAYAVGESITEPDLIADHIIDKNGHILPYVRFVGGQLEINTEAITVLETLANG